MKRIVIATDSWEPLVNGVVTTLTKMEEMAIAAGHQVTVVHPWLYPRVSCPGYPDIKLAYNVKLPADLYLADHIHVATEGPIGWAVKRWCKKNDRCYNTSYHTNFPDYLKTYYKVPKALTYFFIKQFHRGSQSVLVPTLTTKLKLEAQGFKNLVVWGRGYDETIFKPVPYTRVNKSSCSTWGGCQRRRTCTYSVS